MRRLLVMAFVLLGGGAALAFNAERVLVFFFDATRTPPQDNRLEEITWRASDGTRLILWRARPTAGKPSVLYFHGNAGNLADRAARFSWFLDQGFGLVAMAYPGSSGSEGTVSSKAINRYAQEVYAAMPELLGDGPAALYGESLGTGVALQLAAGLEMPPAGVVLEAPYTSILDIGRRSYPRLGPYLHYLGDPWVSRENILTLAAPLLILHGTRDTTIPADMGQALFDLAPGKDKRLVLVEGAGHGNVWQPQAKRALARFLNRL